jgi:hypothetical protein
VDISSLSFQLIVVNTTLNDLYKFSDATTLVFFMRSLYNRYTYLLHRNEERFSASIVAADLFSGREGSTPLALVEPYSTHPSF